MKKLVFTATMIGLLSSNVYSNPQKTQTLEYSLESQKIIQRIKEDDVSQKQFCEKFLSGVPAIDSIGQAVIKNTCIADYMNYNIINSWGDELYNLALSSNKKPQSYNYALPITPLDKEKFMAINAIKTAMFWSSIDRYNIKVQSTPAKEPVTKEQYDFFKGVYEKVVDKSNASLKPVSVGLFNPKSYALEDLKNSKFFMGYAQSLAENKKMFELYEKNMNVVFTSFNSYKEYLDFIYSKKMDEMITNPEKNKNIKLTKVQCATLALSVPISEYKDLETKTKFTCAK